MKITVALLLMLMEGLISAQEKVILPRDESAQDPKLAIFVTDLKKAIAAKDENWIQTALDKDVMSSLGDEPGVNTFLNYWTPENDSTDFWPYLKRVVDMGGVFLHDEGDETGRYQFVFPYTYDVDLEIEDDYYMAGVITGKNVNLRSAPNTNSTVVTKLSHNVIFFIYDEDLDAADIGLNSCGDPEWYQVITYDKKFRGWVNWQYVYSLLGPRLFLFKDKKGDWRISAFVAGD